MTIGLANDKTVNVARVLLTPEQFMEFIRADHPPGTWALADEIGSWMPARDYMTLANKLLSLVLETWRYKRHGIIWTVPQIRQADINVRTMANINIETIRVIRKQHEVEAKLKYVETDSLTGNVYRKFPVITNTEGYKQVITRIFIDRPPKELEKLYLEKKEEHMEQFYEQIHHQLMTNNEDVEMEEIPSISCPHCEHTWRYKGKSKKIQCPSCRKLFDNLI